MGRIPCPGLDFPANHFPQVWVPGDYLREDFPQNLLDDINLLGNLVK
jgi:hypothetical protein